MLMKKLASLFLISCVAASTLSHALTLSQLSQCSLEAGSATGDERKSLVKSCLEGVKTPEKDDGTPLQRYEGSFDNASLLCEMDFANSQSGGKSHLEKCISDGKSNIKKAYNTASKTVKKPAAKAALKEHYISSISALQGIEPQANERKMNYEKRQSDNKAKRDELWVRFEVEN